MRIRFTLGEGAITWLATRLKARGVDTAAFAADVDVNRAKARTPDAVPFSWPPERVDAFVAQLEDLAQHLWAISRFDDRAFVLRVVGHLKERKLREQRNAERAQRRRASRKAARS